ncbi:hypothetical protein [Marinoscillum sp.]|uniref:hypothetical protein n=1 Tax=Marinoscillum sp. TaxID=2024838 RepID=UPI003BAC1AB2
MIISLSVCQLSGKELEGGIKFNSYEKIKDLRTGLNLTPDELIHIGSTFQMNFEFGLWRGTEAYGHIFRIVGTHNNNIDLISSPYNSKFDDLNLILGDSMTAVSFSFEEVGLTTGKWMKCQLTISENEGLISLSINGVKKVKQIAFNFEQVSIAFGKNDMGRYTTSDVPPMNLRNVVLMTDEGTVRTWPLTKHRESVSYDEVGYHMAEAINPNWIVESHVKWKLKKTVNSNSRPQIVYDQDSVVYLLTSSDLYSYNLVSGETGHTLFNQEIPVPFNQASLYRSSSNEIWVYDLDSLEINFFDLVDKSYYEINSNFSSQTSHWHANKLLTSEGRAIFFGGYGHYTYTNNLLSHDTAWKVSTLNEIEPRYLDAFGQNSKGELFIFGGYGSKNGSQEYGARAFHQLFKVDPISQAVTLLWSKEEEAGGNVFSNSMVFGSSDSVFYVLRYPRDKFNSKAVLESFNLYTREKETLGDSIELDFLDTSSFVDLFLNKSTQELVAVILKTNGDQYTTSFYGLKFPPVRYASITQSKPYNYLYQSVIGLVLLLGLVGFWLNHKRKSVTQESSRINTPKSHQHPAELMSEGASVPRHEEPINLEKDFEDKKSAILFLGGFQVLDKDGNEISEKFSSTLRTLLSMLLLYSSNQGKGVPSNFIWEFLWGDKSQNSARNNRNVNIKKLRDLLETVGTIEIKNASDKWKIELGDDVFFDYGHLMQCMKNNKTLTPALLELIKRGNILPSFELDWIDPYKAELSNKVVDYLLGHRNTLAYNAQLQLDIANCIFQHDIINQDALFIKIKYLNSMKKFALAKQCYETYRKEYHLLYDEDFDVPFDEIVKGNEHV